MTSECTKTVRFTKVKIEENKRKAVFRNPKKLKYEVTMIDDCLIKTGIRADYLVTEASNLSALVELKGTGVSHACDQLFASAENQKVKELIGKKLGFLVICSKYPRFDGFVAKAKQRAADKYKAGFHVIQNEGEFNIADVVDIEDM